MERQWTDSFEHIIKFEDAQIVIYPFPTVRCYKCPYCGPSSPKRTLSGISRHLSACKEREKSMQHGFIANPRKFKFVGFTKDDITSMTQACASNESPNDTNQGS